MSSTSTSLGPEHFAYLAQRTRPEDEFLRRLKDEAKQQSIPAIWISPEQASFMQILLQLCAAREVVEVGTLAGYSAIAMARALPTDGRVRTIELEEQYADFAEGQIACSDMAARIEVLRGSGLDVLPRLEDDSADALFIDADKENYPAYLDHARRIVRSGGLVLVDNAFAFGQILDPEVPSEGSVGALRGFNDAMAEKSDLHAIIVPIGDGLWVAVKA